MKFANVKHGTPVTACCGERSLFTDIRLKHFGCRAFLRIMSKYSSLLAHEKYDQLQFKSGLDIWNYVSQQQSPMNPTQSCGSLKTFQLHTFQWLLAHFVSEKYIAFTSIVHAFLLACFAASSKIPSVGALRIFPI